MTSPRIEELPEEVEAAIEAALHDYAAERKYANLRTDQMAEIALRAVIGSGRFIRVPKGQVGVALERTEAEALTPERKWSSPEEQEQTTRLAAMAYAKISQALAQVEEQSDEG